MLYGLSKHILIAHDRTRAFISAHVKRLSQIARMVVRIALITLTLIGTSLSAHAAQFTHSAILFSMQSIHADQTKTDTAFANLIYSTLIERLETKDLANVELLEEMSLMAFYFSQFPHLEPMFSQLNEAEWSLHYAPHTHHTEIQGSRLAVETVRVQFDPYSAVQVKFHRDCRDSNPHCFASPADVLLHELIHVHTALSDPAEYIAQGGLSRMLYPYQHERSVIAIERAFYRAMTELDGLPRPLRSEHVGKARQTACAICLE